MSATEFNMAELEESLQFFDWKEAFYDPLYNHIEADSQEDKLQAGRMEQLIESMQALYHRDEEGKVQVEEWIDQNWKRHPMESQVTDLFSKSNNEKMVKDQVLSEEVFNEAIRELASQNHWVAINTIPYLLEKGDAFFFRTREVALEFSYNNISEYDHFKVIHASSLQELLHQIPYSETPGKNLFNTKNMSIMIEKNLEYLKDNVKYHGFGETLNPELENQLKKGSPEFTLDYKTDVNKRSMEATLHFKKSDSTDMYFFNKYDARITAEKNDQSVAQTFYLNKGQGVTLKEAYNLLNGRAVHKELVDKNDQKYQAWIQLDFAVKDKNGNFERKQYHQNYGFDLKEALSYYPIKEMMKDAEKEKLIRSLEKGNVQMVTVETPGKDIKVFMEANPQYKTINLYNGKMQSLDKEQRQELMQKPEVKDVSKDQSQEKELKQEEKQDSKKSVKQNVSEDPDTAKKKTSRKKGMSV